MAAVWHNDSKTFLESVDPTHYPIENGWLWFQEQPFPEIFYNTKHKYIILDENSLPKEMSSSEKANIDTLEYNNYRLFIREEASKFIFNKIPITLFILAMIIELRRELLVPMPNKTVQQFLQAIIKRINDGEVD